MIFAVDFFVYFVLVTTMVSFVAFDAFFITGETKAAASDARGMHRAFEAGEYLLYALAPVRENAVQHHEIDAAKMDAIKNSPEECSRLEKEALVSGLYLALDGQKYCGEPENKTIIKRIVLRGDDVSILEVGA